MKPDDRLVVKRVLMRVLNEGASLTSAFEDQHVSPFAKALCFSFCRYYFAVEKIALQLVEKKPKDNEVWIILLMGLVELQYLSTKTHAVVSKTVSLLDNHKSWAKGLVNAILRRYCREKNGLLQSIHLSDNHPAWLVAKLKKDWPDNVDSILKAFDEHPPFSLRINQQKISRSEYLSWLNQTGLLGHKMTYSPQGVVLEKPCDLNQLPGFSDGVVSLQDEGAQLAASLMDLQPKLRVLDACCAPGGKLCHLLETEPSLTCIGLDIDQSRLMRVQQNLEREGLSVKLCQGDVRQVDSWWDGQHFDRILLDAPCSATGVIRRHPDIKLLRRPQDIEAVVLIQKDMLESLWTVLKIGGFLLYVTCSVLTVENQNQIQAFIKNHPDCTILNIKQPWGIDTGFGRQILPGSSQSDGFFYCVLQKTKLP